MVDLKTYVIGTLTLALLISLGFNINPDDTHFCRDLEIGKYCDRLSGTEKTCYPTPGTRLGSKLCSSGWEELLQVTEEDLTYSYDSSNIGAQFLCSPQGCIQIR